MLKISEQYFESLLNTDSLSDGDASEAVLLLANFWGSRIDETKKMFNLSIYEYEAELVITYFAQVSNGGHSQFLLNNAFNCKDLNYFDKTITALEKVGLANAGGLVLQAKNIMVEYLSSNVTDINEKHTVATRGC